MKLSLSQVITILALVASVLGSWYDLKTRLEVLRVTQELSTAGLAARVDALEHKHTRR